MSEASFAVSQMVRDSEWKNARHIDTGEFHEVAILNNLMVGPSTERNGLWFGVTRAGQWSSISRRDDEDLGFRPLLEEDWLTVGLVRMLQLSPMILRYRLRDWPLKTEVELDELWELVPWKQAVRTGLRWKNNNWTRLAVAWIVELDAADEFAEDLRESTTDDTRQSRCSDSLKQLLLFLAESSD